MHRRVQSVLPAVVLGLAVALCSCGGPTASQPSDTALPDRSSPSATATPAASLPTTEPSSAPPSTPAPATTEPSSAPPSGASSAALSTFSGSWEDVQYSFDHPSNWTVEDTTAEGQGAGTVSVLGPDGTQLASLGVLIAWGAECAMGDCEGNPVVHFGDVPGQAPLTRSGPFVVRSLAMDLTDSPEARSNYSWTDNVRVVTSLSSNTEAPPASLMPGLMYGLGLVETGVVAGNGATYRTVLFTSTSDFGTLGEAQAYAGTEEHAQIQAMIASFREGR